MPSDTEPAGRPVYLVHADGALPNLALMRLARYHRERGRTVRLVRGDRTLYDPPGDVFGSSIFAFSGERRARLERSWGQIRWGGTGVRVESSLAEVDPSCDWEAIAPDYSDYPDYPHSIGFTQRGCRLSCKFCVVPAKEGRARSVRSVADLWRGAPHPRNLALLDNDFFGQPPEAWRARLDEIRSGGFRVSFAQGINIRLIDEEAAAALATIEYRDGDFQRRRLYTAWDNLRDEEIFFRGVGALTAAGVPAAHLMVYMLVGYRSGETFNEIMYRFERIVALGARPYPMVYDRSRGDLLAFARWAIRGLYRAVSWADYRDPRKEAARAS